MRNFLLYFLLLCVWLFKSNSVLGEVSSDVWNSEDVTKHIRRDIACVEDQMLFTFDPSSTTLNGTRSEAIPCLFPASPLTYTCTPDRIFPGTTCHVNECGLHPSFTDNCRFNASQITGNQRYNVQFFQSTGQQNTYQVTGSFPMCYIDDSHSFIMVDSLSTNCSSCRPQNWNFLYSQSLDGEGALIFDGCRYIIATYPKISCTSTNTKISFTNSANQARCSFGDVRNLDLGEQVNIKVQILSAEGPIGYKIIPRWYTNVSGPLGFSLIPGFSVSDDPSKKLSGPLYSAGVDTVNGHYLLKVDNISNLPEGWFYKCYVGNGILTPFALDPQNNNGIVCRIPFNAISFPESFSRANIQLELTDNYNKSYGGNFTETLCFINEWTIFSDGVAFTKRCNCLRGGVFVRRIENEVIQIEQFRSTCTDLPIRPSLVNRDPLHVSYNVTLGADHVIYELTQYKDTNVGSDNSVSLLPELVFFKDPLTPLDNTTLPIFPPDFCYVNSTHIQLDKSPCTPGCRLDDFTMTFSARDGNQLEPSDFCRAPFSAQLHYAPRPYDDLDDYTEIDYAIGLYKGNISIEAQSPIPACFITNSPNGPIALPMTQSTICDETIDPSSLLDELSVTMDSDDTQDANGPFRKIHVHLTDNSLSRLPSQIEYTCRLEFPTNDFKTQSVPDPTDLCTLIVPSSAALYDPLGFQVAFRENNNPVLPPYDFKASNFAYFLCRAGDHDIVLLDSSNACFALNINLTRINVSMRNNATHHVAVAEVLPPLNNPLPSNLALGCQWRPLTGPNSPAKYTLGSCEKPEAFSSAFDGSWGVQVALFSVDASGGNPVLILVNPSPVPVCYVDDKNLALSKASDLCSPVCSPLNSSNTLFYTGPTPANTLFATLPLGCSVPASIYGGVKVPPGVGDPIYVSLQDPQYGVVATYNSIPFQDMSAYVAFNVTVNGTKSVILAYNVSACNAVVTPGGITNTSLCSSTQCNPRTKLQFSVSNGHIVANLPANCSFPKLRFEPRVPASLLSLSRKRAPGDLFPVPDSPYTTLSMDIYMVNGIFTSSFSVSVCYLDDLSIALSAVRDVCSAECNPRSALSATFLTSFSLQIGLFGLCPQMSRTVQCVKNTTQTPSSVAVAAVQGARALCNVSELLVPLVTVNVTVSQNFTINGQPKIVALPQPLSGICFVQSPLLSLPAGPFCDAACHPSTLLSTNSGTTFTVSNNKIRAHLQNSNCAFPATSNSYKYVATASNNNSLAPFNLTQDYLLQPSSSGLFGSATMNLWLANRTTDLILPSLSGSVTVCVLDDVIRVPSAVVCRMSNPRDIAQLLVVRQTGPNQLVVSYDSSQLLSSLKFPNYTHFCSIDPIYNLFYTASVANYTNNTLCVVNTRWNWPLVPFSWLQLDIELRRDGSSFRAPDADVSICYVDAQHIYRIPTKSLCLLTSHPKLAQLGMLFSVQKTDSRSGESTVSAIISQGALEVLPKGLTYNCNGNAFLSGKQGYSCKIGTVTNKITKIPFTLNLVDTATRQTVLKNTVNVCVSSGTKVKIC